MTFSGTDISRTPGHNETVTEAVTKTVEDERRACLLLPAQQAGGRSADTTADKPDKQAAEKEKQIKTDGQITRTRQLQAAGGARRDGNAVHGAL